MNYYQQQLYLAQVNNKDKIIGQVERWRAHKDALLHRGYTVILEYDNQFVFQLRKHPAFNRYYDLSFSSHQIYIENRLQSDLEAIYQGLSREWNINKKDLINLPAKKGEIYYKTQDKKSGYWEHEVDYIYFAQLKKPPKINLDYAYNLLLIEKKIIHDRLPIKNLAPWVNAIISNRFV